MKILTRIIEFNIDGTTHYAIRKFSLLTLCFKYKDLRTPPHWWLKGSEFFKDCLTTDRRDITRALHNWSYTKKTVREFLAEEQVFRAERQIRRIQNIPDTPGYRQRNQEEVDEDNRIRRLGVIEESINSRTR